ncbi:MAG: hypothetical protein ACI4KN_08040 [Gemmiger sp.]
MITEAIRNRIVQVILAAAVVLMLAVLPAGAESEDFDQTMDRLDRLQTLAEQYIKEQGNNADPIDLTLGFTRVGTYNTTIWQITAGVRDPGFESYATDQDPDLWNLQGMGTAILPNGQTIDMGHLLASMNLVYRGIPLAGSWGGDCMELAQEYAGQADDAAGYAALMQNTFAMDDDGTNSVFGDQDLRADLDSVVAGSSLEKDGRIADVLRSYYADLDDYSRASRFIAMSFGSVDTGSVTDFADNIYTTMVKDAGMQLLLYMNQMWGEEDWSILPEYEPALRGSATVLAQYLSTTVGGEKIKSDSTVLMKTQAGQALVDALNAMGETDAASHAQQSLDSTQNTASPAPADRVTKMYDSFDGKIFQLILVVIGAAAVLGMVVFTALLITHKRSRKQ